MQLHPAFQAEIGAEAKRLTSKYSVPLHVDVVNPPVSEDPRTVHAFAWADQRDKRHGYPVEFNARKFGPRANPDRTRAELAATAAKPHYSLERRIPDILTHEYGHVLTYHLSFRQQALFFRDLARYLRSEATSERHLYAALSEYGVSDEYEAAAEAFVLFDRGADHPAARIAEKYLGKFVR
jgi:hypothetical protein